MIPNEASCPVFSFTFRRKSVVELRSKRKKKERKRIRARAYLLFSFPSFFFSSLNFLCSLLVLPRFPVLCRDANHDFRSIWRVAKCRRDVILQKKKARPVANGRPNADVCTFHTFPKSSQEKDVCDFCTCYALWRKREKNGKERCKTVIIRDMTKRDGNVRRKLMIFN